MMPSARLGAMSGVPKAPAAPRLRAIREAWLRSVIGQLEADPGISAVGFVGSIGRGDADDWSDVDLVIVVLVAGAGVVCLLAARARRGPEESASRSS
jgi:predicted nucleotidyltransferase